MLNRRSFVPTAIGLLVTLAILFVAESPAWGAGIRRALLVGVGDYPYLMEKWRLEGPGNDVALMRRLLTERFEFEPADVVELTGGPEDDNGPTHDNIAGAFRRLAETSGPDDIVVILLAGHGSQLPADEDPSDPERDGWDETFLPVDVRGWPGGNAEESIRDDEIREWVGAIAAKGTFVWLIADSCHSGTYLRDATERTRWIPPKDLLGEEVAGKTRGSGSETADRPRETNIVGLPTNEPNVVATYAALPDQQTPEKSFHGTQQGLFTYTIAKVLEQASAPLTYRELIDRVRTEYGLRTSSTPFAEGGGQDREVLGLEEWPAIPRFHLQRAQGGELKIDAGELQGLRPGSVLAVYPPAGASGAQTPVGHVRAAFVQSISSTVEPVAWADLPAPGPEKLIDGSRCAVVHVEYGDERLRVAVQRERAQPNGTVSVEIMAPGRGPELFERAWSRMERGPALRVTDVSKAEWLVRLVGDEVIVGPVSGWPDGPPDFFRIQQSNDPEILAARLGGALERVAKAQHLIRIAGDSTGEGSGGIKVKLEAKRVGGPGPRGPLVPGPSGVEVRAGDAIELRVKNASIFPEGGLEAPTLDVGLFYLDAEHAITLIMPSTEFAAPDSRLKPGEEQPVEIRISGEPSGWEQVVLLAIPVKGAQTPDFSAWLTARETRKGPPPKKDPLRDFGALLLTWRTLKSGGSVE